MKKLISFVLGVVLCVSLIASMASCSTKTFETFNDASPEDLYALSLASIATMDNYEIVHEQTITTSAFVFFKYSIKQDITVKVDGDDFYQNIECDEEGVWDSDDVLECWYVDEYLYAQHTGMLRKEHFDPSEMKGSIYDFDNLDGTLLDLPEEYFKESKFHSKKGDVYLEFKIDGDKYYDMVLASGGDTDLIGEADGDVRYRVYFHDDGTVDRINSVFKCTITEDGVSVKTKIEVNSIVKNVGTTSITLPSGADSAPSGNYFYIY